MQSPTMETARLADIKINATAMLSSKRLKIILSSATSNTTSPTE
jgi:hypothetical protein